MKPAATKRQTGSKQKTLPVVYILVADNFKDLGIHFHGQARMSMSNMGHTFCRGKALLDDLRQGINDTIVQVEETMHFRVHL